MQRSLAVALTLAAVLWTAALLLLPLPIVRRAPGTLTAVVYAAGTLVCHQRPERSFHVSGTRLPVCARCTGLYVAGTIGALAGWVGLAAVPRRSRALVAAVAVPTAITLVLEWTGAARPSNVVRAAAALPLGGAAGWLFVRLLRADGRADTAL